jgi:hypothetical protein
MDTMIAGHAIALGSVLVTNNEAVSPKSPGSRWRIGLAGRTIFPEGN